MSTTGLAPGHGTRQHADGSRTGAGSVFSWLLVITGALGGLASAIITIDKFKLLQDPTFVPSCSMNPVLSCSDVMKSPQASVFGFPNPVIGLLAFGAVTAIGFGLLAGARYRRWYWLGLNLGTLGGVVFCMWLMTQALYAIGALCLWCMLVWAVTITLFWYTTAHNIRHGIIPAPRAAVAAVTEFHWVVPVTWCLAIVMLIGTRFWSYWQTLL